jgi:hypothetical protein
MRDDRGLEASPRCAVYWKWKGGVHQDSLDDAKVALSELEADGLVVQAKAPARANSSTPNSFAARVLDVLGLHVHDSRLIRGGAPER